jgi:hypothetical protein
MIVRHTLFFVTLVLVALSTQHTLAALADENYKQLVPLCPKAASLYANVTKVTEEAAAETNSATQQKLGLQAMLLHSSEGNALLDCGAKLIGKDSLKAGVLFSLAADSIYAAATVAHILGVDNRSTLANAFDAATDALEALNDPSLAGNASAAAERQYTEATLNQIKNAESLGP